MIFRSLAEKLIQAASFSPQELNVIKKTMERLKNTPDGEAQIMGIISGGDLSREEKIIKIGNLGLQGNSKAGSQDPQDVL